MNNTVKKADTKNSNTAQSKEGTSMKELDIRRIVYTLLISATVSGTIAICSLGRSIHRQRTEARASAAQETVTEPLYRVCEYEGRAAVFRRNLETPYKILDIDIKMLSDYDRAELAGGITFETDAELRRYIEDVSS